MDPPTPRSTAVASVRTATTPAALAATLGLAAASWVVAVRQMNVMDMRVATELGSFGSFLALWVSMMAAMMLPGSAPAVLRRAHASGRVRAVPSFVASYLAVWTLIGVAVYALYRPHGPFAPARLRSLQVSTSSHRSSSIAAGAAARASALDSSSAATVSARP